MDTTQSAPTEEQATQTEQTAEMSANQEQPRAAAAAVPQPAAASPAAPVVPGSYASRGTRPEPLRSPYWPALERWHLNQEPSCQACGSLVRLQVHHILPIHLFPAQELDPSNLITLCESAQRCHLMIGHNGCWHRYNEHVRSDAARRLAKMHPPSSGN